MQEKAAPPLSEAGPLVASGRGQAYLSVAVRVPAGGLPVTLNGSLNVVESAVPLAVPPGGVNCAVTVHLAPAVPFAVSVAPLQLSVTIVKLVRSKPAVRSA